LAPPLENLGEENHQKPHPYLGFHRRFCHEKSVPSDLAGVPRQASDQRLANYSTGKRLSNSFGSLAAKVSPKVFGHLPSPGAAAGRAFVCRSAPARIFYSGSKEIDIGLFLPL
jgi:hypothetical protein